jgi:hypothetical protein
MTIIAILICLAMCLLTTYSFCRVFQVGGGSGWSASKESIAAGNGLYVLSGGDWKMVLRALEPHEDGTPVTFQEACDKIVDERIRKDA